MLKIYYQHNNLIMQNVNRFFWSDADPMAIFEQEWDISLLIIIGKKEQESD